MCRWLAYTGSPALIQDALYTPAHSLIDQSLHSRLGAETTNGDGFGIGWYDAEPTPGVFRSIEPAWNDQNLRELAGHVRSHLFFAHIRAAIGSAVQQTNCHPFRHGRWLFMHNGFIDGFATIKRDLVLAIDESLYPDINGQTDTEVLFNLALTFGLEDDPPRSSARRRGPTASQPSRTQTGLSAPPAPLALWPTSYQAFSPGRLIALPRTRSTTPPPSSARKPALTRRARRPPSSTSGSA
jgi:predicted glutamine amidotransferase